jgi:di/tricarboxylate transporter
VGSESADPHVAIARTRRARTVNPAVASLLALVAAIILSIVTRVNVGVVAVAFAWIVGAFVADLGAATILDGFPASLFITLLGVTLLFAAAYENGTLERLAHRAVRLARGNARLLPVIFFGIAATIAMVGPGAIASVALVVPLAMAVGTRAGVPHFLTALVVANGANAGNLSPISSVGVIANTTMAEAGLGAHPGKVWFANLAAHALVALIAYVLLGGWKLEGRSAGAEIAAEDITLSRVHRFTVAVILLWIAGVLILDLNLGLSAFAAVTLLIATRAVEDAPAIKRVPWGAIVMVTGVSMLVALLEATGGMELFTALLSRIATPGTVNGVIAFVTGAISTYSSTSGVVLPAFLPAVPGIVERLAGADPLAVALSINVGASMVDVSPLSTLGALCVAAVPDPATAQQLFRQLLIWGVSMAVVAAILCQLLAGPLARL